MKQEIREKSSEQKSLRSEKKGTSIFNVKKQMELSQRIAELTEDLEELCSERTMLLNQLDCADDKEVKKVKTSVSTIERYTEKSGSQGGTVLCRAGCSTERICFTTGTGGRL